MTSSIIDYPSKTYADVLLNRPEVLSKFDNISAVTYEKLKENIAKINVYYETTVYEQTAESPSINIVSLLSNIGIFKGANFIF